MNHSKKIESKSKYFDTVHIRNHCNFNEKNYLPQANILDQAINQDLFL